MSKDSEKCTCNDSNNLVKCSHWADTCDCTQRLTVYFGIKTMTVTVTGLDADGSEVTEDIQVICND
jgi:hypothetical protein